MSGTDARPWAVHRQALSPETLAAAYILEHHAEGLTVGGVAVALGISTAAVFDAVTVDPRIRWSGDGPAPGWRIGTEDEAGAEATVEQWNRMP